MASQRLLFWHLHTANCSADRLALSPCDEIRHLNCLAGFIVFKCSVLIPSVEVSGDQVYCEEVSGLLSSAKYKKLATVQQCNRTSLLLFFLWLRNKEIHGWTSATCQTSFWLSCWTAKNTLLPLFFTSIFFSHGVLIVRGNIWTLLFSRFLDILTNVLWKVILIWWDVI